MDFLSTQVYQFLHLYFPSLAKKEFQLDNVLLLLLLFFNRWKENLEKMSEKMSKYLLEEAQSQSKV